MKCKVIRTDKADEQLREIIFYIADDSGSIDIVLDYLNERDKIVTIYAFVDGRQEYKNLL